MLSFENIHEVRETKFNEINTEKHNQSIKQNTKSFCHPIMFKTLLTHLIIGRRIICLGEISIAYK